MNALLVRVGADCSAGGGSWNGPVDSKSGDFAYVPIPETKLVHSGLEKAYSSLDPVLERFRVELPLKLRLKNMHLDPDFTNLTYGDQGRRAKQLLRCLDTNDMIVFYAGLKDVRRKGYLIYAIIGLLIVKDFLSAVEISKKDRDINAHSRRVLAPDAEDIVVRGQPGVSGRLKRCLPIGEFRDRAYRVQIDLLEEWGGLSVKDGYLQRSASLPRFLDVPRFVRWLKRQKPVLLQANN